MKSYPLAKANTLQNLIKTLEQFWCEQGCVLLQPLGTAVSSGVFHPATFLKSIGPELWQTAYIQPCNKPQDSRYNQSLSKLQNFHQFQVFLKPSPSNIQQLYLESLKVLGIDTNIQELRFKDIDREYKTLDIKATGWKVSLNGTNISQLTYLQRVGGIDCYPVPGSISYGIERLAMHLQNADRLGDLVWSINAQGKTTSCADIMQQSEFEMSALNMQYANTELLSSNLKNFILESQKLLKQGLVYPSYHYLLQAIHTLDTLITTQATPQDELQRNQQQIQEISRAIAMTYYQTREGLGFPLTPDNIKQVQAPKTAVASLKQGEI